MAKQITRWSPDTCGCVLDLAWDSSVLPDNRVHTLEAVVKACPAHQALSDAQKLVQVMDENTRKNLVFAEIEKINASITPNDYLWSFTPQRVLEVNAVDLTSANKTQLQTVCDQKFGAGKVKVLAAVATPL